MEEGPRRKKWTGNKREMKLRLASTPASNGNKKELRSSTSTAPMDLVEQGSLCLYGVLSLLLLIFHNNTSLGSCQVN